MKRFLLSLFAAAACMLTGCYETTQEITLNENGSGTFSTVNNMSTLMEMAKQMDTSGEMAKAGDQKIDSAFSLANGADSIADLTPEEKEIVRKGNVHLKMNTKDNQFITQFTFPFSSISQIAATGKVAGKMMTSIIKDKAGEGAAALGGQGMPEISSFDDYYTVTYKKGVFTKTLNKEKYASVADDEYLKMVKGAASAGLTLKAIYIINLPSPAKKAEGKGIKLSDDKKKITIEADIDDFFDDPSKLEYNIEY